MTDFLLELRSEEIPARMQDRARDDLARLFGAELAKAGLTASELTTYATPRRLALIARDLPDETAAVAEELKGPRASAPPQALDGFLRKTGLTRDQLTERDGILYAVTNKPGRATADVLAEAIPAIVRSFPWPKAMRWGAASASTGSLRWVRPLHGIVALFGEAIVPVEIAGIVSGAATLGHRFHHPGVITIGSAADYADKLRACHVLVDQDERRAIVRDGARALAVEAGLELVEDEGLVAENAGLTEWPVPLLGRFDEAFLDVPPEVIQLTARVNQKYFVCRSPLPLAGGAGGGIIADPSAGRDMATPNPVRQREGSLANAFICTANIAARDGGATIVEGNRKVLAARLSDARFFYETDLKVPLEEQAKKLDRIVFHEKLGTVADKVDRVAKLARWLVEEGVIPLSFRGEGGEAQPKPGEGEPDRASRTAPLPTSLRSATLSPEGERARMADLAERAARLAKADLVTGMVGEFPELQGVMGGYYAAAQGEDPQIAAAIRDHYKPVGQGDEVPTALVTVAVSLADKLDSVLAFFAADERPTGSKDPFALRRSMLGVLALIEANQLRLLLNRLFKIGDRLIGQTLARVALGSYPQELRKVEHDFFEALDAGMPFTRRTDSTYQSEYHDKQYNPALSVLLDIVLEAWKSVQLASAGVDLFAADRLKVQQREAGVRHDLIDAVFALGGEDDLVRLLARVRALQAFIVTDDGANLLAGYKRAANILKKEGYLLSPLRGEGGRAEGEVGIGAVTSESADTAPLPDPLPGGESEQASLSYTPESDEAALMHALDTAEPAAAAAVAREDFAAAMAALATLRAPIDAFFDAVTVNDPDAAKRTARLALLDRVRAAVHNVADFSKIAG